MDIKMIIAVVAALYALYMMFKDKLPALSKIKNLIPSTSKTGSIDRESKLEILQRLWDIRSKFETSDSVYKNITVVIDDLVHYQEKSEKSMVVVNEVKDNE
jgi:hypothetical protein